METNKCIPHIIQCSICGDTDAREYHHSIMMRGNICWLCKLELSIDFYPNPQKANRNNYFKRAGAILGIHEWECRKIYLTEMLETQAGRVDVATCWKQLKEISQFVKIMRKTRKLSVVVPAYLELLKQLDVDAIGVDLR